MNEESQRLDEDESRKKRTGNGGIVITQGGKMALGMLN
jgi:hypothetical protein